MISTPLLPRYKTRINIRPIKYAYFVKENDVENLNNILRISCTQWGGIRNLIIPVKSDLTIAPLFQGLIDHHEPDLFIGFLSMKADNMEDHNKFQKYLSQLWPHRVINLQVGRFFLNNDRTAHVLSVVSDDDLHKHELIEHDFTWLLSDYEVLLALFGAILPENQKDYAEIIKLKRQQIGIDDDNFWESQFENSPFSSILNLTSYGVSPYRATGSFESNHFDVILVNSFSSFCTFWNFRATREAEQFLKGMGRRTLFLPEKLLNDKQALQKMIYFIRSKLPCTYISTNLHLRFCVWDEEDLERLEIAINELDGIEKFSDKEISWSTDEKYKFEDFSEKSIKYSFIIPNRSQSYFEGFGYQVAVNSELVYGRNEVFFNPPPGFRNRFRGLMVIDLECDVLSRYPKDHRIAENIKSYSWFSRYGISFVGRTADHGHYIDFNLPNEWETLKVFFGSRGYDIRLSQPGKYADALIELVGGLNHINTLASKPAYLLLDTLALKSTKKLAQRIVGKIQKSGIQIDDNLSEMIQPLLEDVEVVPELKRIPKTYSQLKDGSLQPYKEGVLELLAQLSKLQIIKRGFYLTCQNCGTPSWHPLQIIKETVSCPGCSAQFPLPVEHPARSEIRWEYMLNTLVNRVMDQDALPSVLALHYLTKDKNACCIVPGLELLQSNEVKAELDFIYISNHEIYAGECKAGKEIGGKDIDTARLASNLGINHFYYCTVSQFNNTTKERIEELKSELKSKNILMSFALLNGENLIGESI